MIKPNYIKNISGLNVIRLRLMKIIDYIILLNNKDNLLFKIAKETFYLGNSHINI